MNLLECESGVSCSVVSLRGGQRFRQRLGNMGLAEGKELVKLHNHPFRGPVTVRVGNTELALGRGMADRIEVVPNPSQSIPASG